MYVDGRLALLRLCGILFVASSLTYVQGQFELWESLTAGAELIPDVFRRLYRVRYFFAIDVGRFLAQGLCGAAEARYWNPLKETRIETNRTRH